MQPSALSRRQAFTLVELLVVIAIIGVLVASIARRPGSPRIRAADEVLQQPQANQLGGAQLSRHPRATPARFRRK